MKKKKDPKPLKNLLGILKSSASGWGPKGQWFSACLVCVRPCLCSSELEEAKTKETNAESNNEGKKRPIQVSFGQVPSRLILRP